MQQLNEISKTTTNPYYSSSNIKNNFVYSNDKLSTINCNNNVNYNFPYDKWGNLSQIKTNDLVLISYLYSNDNARNLVKTQYASGQYIDYEYDSNNLIEIYYGTSQNRSLIFKYEYNIENELTEIYDYSNNTKTIYKTNVTEVYDISTTQSTLLYSYVTNFLEDSSISYEKVNGNKFIKEESTENNDYITTFKTIGGLNNEELVLYKQKREIDEFNRINKQSIMTGTNAAETISQTYTYSNLSDNTTNRIASLETSTSGGINIIYSYNYDKDGNLTKVYKNNTVICQYQYDEANQLIRKDNSELNKSYTYKYDNNGNILEKGTFNFTINTTLENPISTIDYGYTDTNWKDKLTSYNGNIITYDDFGNPLTFDGYTYTWEAGIQLSSIANDTLTAAYTYNTNGIRTSKTVNGTKTTYSLIDSKITSETTGNNVIYYRYNGNDELVGLFYSGQEYFYIRNLQNDIIGIINSGGVLCVTYT